MIIEDYRACRMTVDGEEYGHDLKIIDGRVKKEWWRKQDHKLDLGGLSDILSAGPEILVVGTGYAGHMRVEEPLRSALEQRGIRLVAIRTPEAVKRFNDITSEGKNVAGAFHLTC
jgi:hypothetical protein